MLSGRSGLGLTAIFAAVGFGPCALAESVAPEPDMRTLRYICDRGVEVPATYVNGLDLSVAVINVEGSQISLYLEQSGSGARYGWPSDGANYVWWTKGAEATLYWKEGGVETPLLACNAAG